MTYSMPKGDGRPFKFHVRKDGQPLSLAGFTVTMYLRRNVDDDAAIATQPCTVSDDTYSALAMLTPAMSSIAPQLHMAVRAVRGDEVYTADRTLVFHQTAAG